MKKMALKQGWSFARTGVLPGVLLVVFSALPALSQSGPPAPAPELAQLSFFVGDWSCTGQADESPIGPAHATRATVHIGNDVGGFWYVGHYKETKTAANPHPMIFHFVQGYDAAAKTFVMDCFDLFGSHCHQISAAGRTTSWSIAASLRRRSGHARPRHLHQQGKHGPGARRRDAGRRQVDAPRSRGVQAGREVKVFP